jgi:adenylate kinase
VEIAVGDEEIVARVSGRRVHPGSGRIYHVKYNPPQQAGVDDETGEALIQRDDDTEETVRKRLEIYYSQTSPLIDFYQNMSGDDAPGYHRIDGVGSVEAIRDAVFASLEA